MPKVSVILSVQNQEKFLPASIESILKQSFVDFEFIIVDDASTSKSLQIIKEFAKKDKRIKILRNKKKIGLTKSLNKAIKESKGEYIARMDADDISLDKRLENQVKFLDSRSQLALVGSWVILIDKDGRRLKLKKMPIGTKKILKTILAANPFIHSTIMFRRVVLEDVGFYNPEYLYAQDYELILRILRNYKAENIAKPLLLYRVGEANSLSVRKIKQQEKFALKARLVALKELGYPTGKSLYLLKPLLSFLLPAQFKLLLYKIFFWR